MPFFDFHCHPGLKPTFTDQANAPSPWQFIDARLRIFNNVDISINSLFNEVLNSQCCLNQLFAGEVRLFGIALHAPESNMGKGLLQKRIVNIGRIPLINPDRLKIVAAGNSYFDFTNSDLNRLSRTAAPSELNNAKLKILNRLEDFDESDQSTIYGFLIIEGLHCFFEDQTAADANDIFTKNFEDFTDKHTVLAINVCHLQQNVFCNHAFGIQFINPQYFFPVGNGFTEWGKAIVKRMIEKNILVDTKHMSLRSRLDLYSMLRDSDNPDKFKVPIICTHAGLTGQSMNDRVKYLMRKPLDVGPVYEICYFKPKSPHIKQEQVYFNCSSINLYDEDIEAILLSGGLIGLSFDQRIVGFADENVLRDVTTPNDVEYISKDESVFFLGPNLEALELFEEDDELVWSSEDFERLDPSMNIILHPLFFFNQVMHILTVAQKNPSIGAQKAAGQICLGTDYDGLINAIDNCKQVDKLEGFKQYALSKLPNLLKGANLEDVIIDIDQFVENIFYNNGKRFVLDRLSLVAP